jgi:hypothetical protein
LFAVLLACGTTLSVLPSPAVATVSERFHRVDTMPVFENSSAGEHTAAEIAAATPDGKTVVYTDSPTERIGFAKKVYRVDISGITPVAAGESKPLVAKTFAHDLLPALTAGGGAAHDKPEGLAVVGDGPVRRLVGVVDNDGVEDAPGESVFLRLGRIR